MREQGMGAALFGSTKLYGEVPGAQAEYLRVPQGTDSVIDAVGMEAHGSPVAEMGQRIFSACPSGSPLR